MYSDSSPEAIASYISEMASAAGVDPRRVLHIAGCESGFQTDRVGDNGTSYGLFQIHLPAHEEVSIAKAHSLVYSTAWALDQMQNDAWSIWTCDKLVN